MAHTDINKKKMLALYDLCDWLETMYPGRPNRLASVCIDVTRSGYIIDCEAVAVDNLAAHLLSLDRSVPIVFRFSDDRYVRRPLSIRALPFTRALAMACLDAEEHIPFLRNDTRFMISRNMPGRETEYYIIRNDILDPLVEAVARSGHDKIEMQARLEHETRPLRRASVRSAFPLSRATVLKTSSQIAALVILLIFFVGTFIHAYCRNEIATTNLSHSVDAAQTKAVAVRKKIERRQQDLSLLRAARAAKAEGIPVSILWEEITRLLPDTTWLTDLSVQESYVSISGFSSSAADLIAVLSASSLLADPSFTSPVMRVPGQQGERFTVRMSMKKR